MDVLPFKLTKYSARKLKIYLFNTVVIESLVILSIFLGEGWAKM